MMTGYIYGYRFSGRWLYVGQTVDVAKRHKGHLQGPRYGSKCKFDGLLDLLSWSGITPIVLETVEGTNLEDLKFNLRFQETIWMFKLKTYYPCFGRGENYAVPSKSFALGRRWKLSASQRVAIGNSNRGKKLGPLSPERRAQLSVVNRGKTLSPEHRAKLSVAHRGKKLSPEHCANMRTARLGRKLSLEHRAKIAASSCGHKHTPEVRAKIADAARKDWVRRLANRAA
jgi:NUMOD3 motif